MKFYEKLNISIDALSDSDVISTSAEVTTGSIIMPWQKGDASNASIDPVLKASYEPSYKI